jgi:hypothetical protein
MMRKIAEVLAKMAQAKCKKLQQRAKEKICYRAKSSIEKDKVSPDKNPKNTPLNKNM